MEDNYFEQRLNEITSVLFAEGAFFSTMTEEEKNLFGEAIDMMVTKRAKEICANVSCGCASGCCNGQESDSLSDTHEEDYEDGTYSSGEYMDDSSYMEYKEEIINDGAYQEKEYSDQEMIYGDDMEVTMKEDSTVNNSRSDIDEVYNEPVELTSGEEEVIEEPKSDIDGEEPKV